MKENPTFTLAEIAKITESEIVGDRDYKITGFAELDSAGVGDVSFLSNPRYTKTRYVNAMRQSHAGAIFVAPSAPQTEGKNYLINKDPARAFQMIVETFRGDTPKLSAFQGIHPTAVIHESSKMGNNVLIGPHAVIDADVVIGDNTYIGAGSYIGSKTKIGKDSIIHPNVTINEYTNIGDHVVIQPGVVIGFGGFGYSTDDQGKHTHLEHFGNVSIEDDVEIGSNCTVDRARFATTRLGRGTKLDNMVVIGHNVQIGEDNIICGQSAVAGSSRTGNRVIIAGQCGIDGHLELQDGVIITGKSGVSKSLPPGKYGGVPVQPLGQHNRNSVLLRNIGPYVKQLKDLKARIEQLESSK
ncbi:MAG: UDP-3-O-acylglucosamine N-acyltransferase [Chlamydiae bacterium]|nr:UDP-3-O-acylglucosamine N-acyltransferase [Chlamydiota bacterium]